MQTELKQYFKLKELPFELTPDLNYFCNFDDYQYVLDAVNSCIDQGEAIIKITGEVGTGKTLLCRKLVTEFDQYGYQTLYIHNPAIGTMALLKTIAAELQLDATKLIVANDEYAIHQQLNQRLLDYYQQQKRVVLLIDEAQTLTDQSLEAVRLLTNLESENTKLLQIILFGQPELDQRLSQPQLRQLQQRIRFAYRLSSLPVADIDQYISRRLVSAGHHSGRLFSTKANQLLHKASDGIPRVMNILAYKSLLSSYVRGNDYVDEDSVKAALQDSPELLATTKFSQASIKKTVSTSAISTISPRSTISTKPWYQSYRHWGLVVGLISVGFISAMLLFNMG